MATAPEPMLLRAACDVLTDSVGSRLFTADEDGSTCAADSASTPNERADAGLESTGASGLGGPVHTCLKASVGTRLIIAVPCCPIVDGAAVAAAALIDLGYGVGLGARESAVRQECLMDLPLGAAWEAKLSRYDLEMEQEEAEGLIIVAAKKKKYGLAAPAPKQAEAWQSPEDGLAAYISSIYLTHSRQQRQTKRVRRLRARATMESADETNEALSSDGGEAAWLRGVN